MYAKVASFGILGLDAYPISIEADITSGLPYMSIVGLPDSSVRESCVRVRSAIKNSGFKFPSARITINLSPADTKKEGPCYDLAIALSILAADEHVPTELLKPYAFLGELSLDGSILPINGALSFALVSDPAVHQGLIVPSMNATEAALARRVPVYPVRHLKELVAFLSDTTTIAPVNTETSITASTLTASASTSSSPHASTSVSAPQSAPALNSIAAKRPSLSTLDFCDIKGQAHVKRGLEVACAGGHNVILIGPPGSGKTMLAKRLPGILPDMTWEEALEATKIHSVAGLLSAGGIIPHRPFRSPHHTASDTALIGGGMIPKAGEVTLAHNGILFLDELPEFRRHVLEVLRQPLEDGCVTVARAIRTIKFPAKFMLVAAMNPCPCGWRLGGRKTCVCSPLQVERYLNKISGPLLDRIDIHLEASALKTHELFSAAPGEPSAAIKQRTARSRTRQVERLAHEGLYANAQMSGGLVRKYCVLDDEGLRLLRGAVDTLGLSARAHDKILKVARTIADLEGREDIRSTDVAEAIGYRTLDRMRQ